MCISDWSSDVCTSDLPAAPPTYLVCFDPATVKFLALASDQQNPGQDPTGNRRRTLASELETSLPEGNAIAGRADRKSVVSGKRVSVRVNLGGRGILQKKQ